MRMTKESNCITILMTIRLLPFNPFAYSKIFSSYSSLRTAVINHTIDLRSGKMLSFTVVIGE